MPADFVGGGPFKPTAAQQRLFDLAIWLGLILSTFAVYAQVGGFDFVAYDDGPNVFENAHVRTGLTPANIRWAFSAEVLSNWAPVTVLSHIATGSFFGMEGGAHHLVNVIIHALASGLLFMALRRATGARAMSAFVAFVFALHPLHVQSVAWISERKDVLAALFWFLGLYAYVIYTQRPGWVRYLFVIAAFSLGLMSKPMLVTFPFTLLLFDIWPLRRVQWPKTILEKMLLFALSAAASVIAYFVQRKTGAVLAVPFGERVLTASTSYITYIQQTFWPARLAVLYPYLQSIPVWQGVLALAAVVILTALAILAWKTRPYLTVGWLWYVGTLVPVIGLVRIGDHAHSDRYMYIPLVGLSMMVAWGAGDAMRKWPASKLAIGAAAVLCCMACMTVARRETSYWENTETLFRRAIDVTRDNWLAENNLGAYLVRAGRPGDAIHHLETALRIRPDYALAHNNMGVALADLDDYDAAATHFAAAVQIQPNHAEANDNLGKCAMKNGKYADAIPYFEVAIRAVPDFPDAHFNLGASLAKIPGHERDALREYQTALSLAPDDPKAYAGLGELLASLGRVEEAIAHLEVAENLHPDPEVETLLDRLRGAQQ